MEDDGTWYSCAVVVVGLSSAYDRRVKQVRLKYLKHAQFTVDVDESTQHTLTAPPGTHVPLVQKLWKKPPQPNRKRALSTEAEPADRQRWCECCPDDCLRACHLCRLPHASPHKT